MVAKRKTTLKQIFKAWLSFNKKTNEAHKAKLCLVDLARKCEDYSTELIEHEGNVYRVTINNNRCPNYQIDKIAEVSELPVKS